MSAELIVLCVVMLVGFVGYLWNCYRAGRLLTWKEWGDFNGD
jgi:hypothetical protein